MCDGAARALPTCKDPDVGRTMQAVGARVTEWPLLRRVCAAAPCPLALPTWPITRLDPAHAVNVPPEPMACRNWQSATPDGYSWFIGNSGPWPAPASAKSP